MAPFWHVNFADFWIADQMNSLAVVFLDLEYFLCFLTYGRGQYFILRMICRIMIFIV